MSIPQDYVERVYAGVLGKIIGVYLGRPFEGWSYDNIMKRLGEIWYYVHETMGGPLILTDDDITGTFTFLRALPDYGNTMDLTPAQIGQSWLNYIIEDRTILWWGGMGNSTEHTAYLRLKNGIEAPYSGSIELNSKVVAEQIGAQIFIDGWAMVVPGDPESAADLARRAGSVSHDGEAIYGAQVLAAMEAQAFVEPDIDKLLDAGVSFIPEDSVIARMIADIRGWWTEEPDWRKAFALLKADYGYDKYGGNCHMVPNHGLIILSLLYGDNDFQKTLMIVNTCGWDTDCNSGNVGCLMGIKNGLAGLDAGPDWRGPVADRLYLPAADGGRAITDAVTEAYRLVQNSGTGLLMQGTREWTDYRVSADVTPHMVSSAGIAARVQGMRRYYGLLLCSGGRVRLVKALDGNTVLAEADFDWEFGETHELCLEVVGTHLQAWIDDQQIFEIDDTDRPLTGGAVALVCEQGRTATRTVRVQPRRTR